MAEIPPTRGDRLYDSLVTEATPFAVRVMAEEAARITDRLDDLNAQIAEGNGAVMAEARQQANTLRALLAALGVEGQAAAPPAQGGTPLDRLQLQRERRASRKG